MDEKKATYLNEATDDQTNTELTEPIDLFSRLSPEAQDAILDLLHSIVEKK